MQQIYFMNEKATNIGCFKFLNELLEQLTLGRVIILILVVCVNLTILWVYLTQF